MANSITTDLMDLGEHCSAPGCSQIDFLPFTCDCCQQVFCLEHRTYAAHQCAQAAGRTTQVIVCPLCARAVKVSAGQDANAAFDQHTRTECDPSHYDKVHKKPKCPVGMCKEKLGSTNTYHCKSCGQRVCLKHRLPDDHNCAAAKAKQQAEAAAKRSLTPAAEAIANFFKPKPKATSQAELRALAAKQYQDPANSVKGTAERRRQQQPPARPPAAAQRPAATSNVDPLVAPTLPEVCPQCSARFASVERLVQHVEDFHPTAGGSSNGMVNGSSNSTATAGTTFANPVLAAAAARAQQRPQPGAAGGSGGVRDTYRCPKCGLQFHDAVQLVGHSEGCGGVASSGGSSNNCVLC